jgi:hypothetical protein
MIIKHDNYSHIFKGLIDGKEVCSLELWEDENSGDFWLNGIYTHKEGNRHLGYATALVVAALEKYEAIFVSIATHTEHKENGDNTARMLTLEGAAFVYALRDRGILKNNWFVNPFIEYR